MIQKLLNILTKEEKKRFFFVFLTIFISAILESLGITMLVPLLKIIVDKNFIDENNYLQYFKILFNINNNHNLLLLIIILVAVFFILKNILVILINWQNLTSALLFKSRITTDVFKMHLYSSDNSIHRISAAETLRNIQSAERLQHFAFHLISMTTDFLTALFIIITISIIEPLNSLFLVMLISFFLLLYFFSNFFIKKKGVVKFNLVATINKWLLNSINSIKEIKIFGKEKYFYENFKKDLFKFNYIERTAVLIKSLPKSMFEIFFLLVLVFFFLFNSKPDDYSNIIFSLGFYFLILLRLAPVLIKMVASAQIITFNLPEIKLYLEKFSNNSINESVGENQSTISNLVLNSNNNYFLYFNNLSFKYKNALSKNDIFIDINLGFQKNEIIGIYGDSGIGKTTFLDLLTGLLIPTHGGIYSFGRNIHSNIRKWRDSISYVNQNPYIFNDTIINNVAFGLNTNEIDLDKVKSCLKKVSYFSNIESDLIDKFIVSEAGESGSLISGGQKQRLAIARALYRNSKIIILDEATSSLDAKSAEEILKIIYKYKEDKIIFIISHNKDNYKFCDKVYEVKNQNLQLM
jgi:ABC-type multidrug transport system fused ATPase/permease subunit